MLNKQITFLVLISLFLIISGCIGTIDMKQFVKQLPEVQEFLNEHPKAEIAVSLWTKDYIENNTENISGKCLPSIDKNLDYYKVDIKENENEITVWIRDEDKKVICIYRKGLLEEKEESFNWSNASVDAFINYNITPYVISKEALYGYSPTPFFNPKNIKVATSFPSETGSYPKEGIWELVMEYNNDSEVARIFKNITSSNGLYLRRYRKAYKIKVGDEEIYEQIDTMANKTQIGYLWEENRFLFQVYSLNYESLPLIKWIITKYSNIEPTHMEMIETLYNCGDNKCSGWENSDNCCEDCGCSEGYECIESFGGDKRCAEGGVDCLRASILIQEATYENGFLNIDVINSGEATLKNFIFVITYSDSSSKIEERTFNLESLATHTFSIQTDSNVDDVAVKSKECEGVSDLIGRYDIHGLDYS